MMRCTNRLGRHHRDAGYTLVIVMMFVTVTLVVLASALSWCTTNMDLNERNNEYFRTSAAAEAATEKILANLSTDYHSQGESLVYAKRGTYRELSPLESENTVWSEFAFTDGQGNTARTYVERLAAASYVPLESQYQGIYGLASSYRVVSNARLLNTHHQINVGVRQDVQLASIPVFQFAIFYSMDLEINPGPNMRVTGRVHSNANLNMQPVNTLTFQSHVTAAGKLIPTKHTNDPSIRNTNFSQIVYNGEHDANVSTLNLPIGTNNSPDAVHAILTIPPDTEPVDSTMGQQRYHNKTDLVVLVSNSTVTVKSGNFDNFATTIPETDWSKFMTVTNTFYNKREVKTVNTTDLDVAELKSWSETNELLRPLLGRDLRSVYVADMRNNGSYQYGVRVKNGQELPSLGLTVATPNPIYVQGHFNAPVTHQGTTNTSLAKPASLVGDSINVLSGNWMDSKSTLGLSSRPAVNTTVNAAFLGGIVPSGGGYYSGGVENFPRFLESWSNKTLTYNGSMVVMFYSKIATRPWGTSDVYSPPVRQWAFDLNFLDPARLPPGSPEVRALIRGKWDTVQANVVN